MNKYSQPPHRPSLPHTLNTPRHESFQPPPPRFQGSLSGNNFPQNANNFHPPRPPQHMPFHHSQPPSGPRTPSLPFQWVCSGPPRGSPYHYMTSGPGHRQHMIDEPSLGTVSRSHGQNIESISSSFVSPLHTMPSGLPGTSFNDSYGSPTNRPGVSYMPNQPYQSYQSGNYCRQFDQLGIGNSTGSANSQLGQFNFSDLQPIPSLNFTVPPPPVVGCTNYSDQYHQLDDQRTMVSTVSVQSHQAPLQEKGKQLLDTWLQKSKWTKKAQRYDQSTSSQEKGNKALLEQLYQMGQLLAEMTSQVDDMDKVFTAANNTAWNDSLETFTCLKQQFNSLKFKGPKTEQKQRNIQKALRKRARLKRARHEKFEMSLRMKEHCELKSKMIDAWQARCSNILKEENKKKSRKAAADKTLSEVNKEIHDANKLIETMTALQKLRLVRRDAAEKRGDSNLGESRESFEQKISDMIRLVRGQLEFYKEEETRLKSIIKSEVEESNKKEKEDMEEHDQACLEKEDLELSTMLFGGDIDRIAQSDPLFPFAQYYRQAEHDLQTFINIRHQWDAFIVSETTPGASCVPSTWVIPQEPSSGVWASALL